MIQRIQSILMLLAAVCLGCLFTLPFSSHGASDAAIYSDEVFNIQDHIALLIMTIIGALLAVVSIFLFNNRKLQIKINYLGILLSGAILGFAFFFQNKIAGGNYESGFILPIVSLILLVAANYFINKDEKTVRSMDRLR